ncbi:MAG: tRNA (pseudouridine(54)-N(1))-methyltransferase TrmY [Candidatus Methanomethyliales bacterium]|nr:tRNA (pseudouridine(54)-N(1))-methyltransferase TrmY [Candidatus Methanomethylicales archaeon]
MVRTFILKSSEGRTAPDFSLKSLAGSGGRMDLIARCIIATFAIPRGIRKDAILSIVLEGPPNPPVTVTMDGRDLNRRIISEVEAAEVLRDALSGRPVGGVRVERKSFERLIREMPRGSLYYLHENGEEIGRVKIGKDPIFVLGDQKGIDEKGERVLDEAGAKRVSLGPISYLASHCIVIINNELDQMIVEE